MWKVPYTHTMVNHDVNASFYEDGKVQTFKMRTQKLSENKTVFISVTATNHVRHCNCKLAYKYYSAWQNGRSEENTYLDYFWKKAKAHVLHNELINNFKKESILDEKCSLNSS